MTEIDRLLAANRAYAESREPSPGRTPSRGLAVLTCIDTRIDPLAALGLRVGEAVVLRNAGARVTDDVLRTLAVAVHLLDVHTVVVMQHTNCGVTGTTDDALRSITGADLEFHPIADHESSLRDDIARLLDTPYLAGIATAAGLVYDVDTGRAEALCRSSRA